MLFFLTQFALGRLLGIDFATMSDTTDNVRKSLVLRVGIAATLFTLIGLLPGRSILMSIASLRHHDLGRRDP